MTVTIPDSHKDLLERAVVVTLSTVSADGKPSAVPVWRRWDGEFLLITSDPDTHKHRNILANPHVAVVALDHKNPYRYLIVKGIVETVTHDGALEELNRHALMYVGKPNYFGDVEPIEKLAEYNGVVFKIRPTQIAGFG
ncbi:MAG: pyridoxamine 5'-phosphate oxidase family protein [Anaerolineae bacterium]